MRYKAFAVQGLISHERAIGVVGGTFAVVFEVALFTQVQCRLTGFGDVAGALPCIDLGLEVLGAKLCGPKRKLHVAFKMQLGLACIGEPI